ncbi:MAG: hypothetical protein PHH82_02565 [Candidatus ainarchaeum sp.]|nr:hypothetical protein [Candidatus ainarchaeum sp.]
MKAWGKERKTNPFNYHVLENHDKTTIHEMLDLLHKSSGDLKRKLEIYCKIDSEYRTVRMQTADFRINSCLAVVRDLPIKARIPALLELLSVLSLSKGFAKVTSDLLPNLKSVLAEYNPKERQKVFSRFMNIIRKNPAVGHYIFTQINMRNFVRYLHEFKDGDRKKASDLLFNILSNSGSNAHVVLLRIGGLFDFIKGTNKYNLKNILAMLNKLIGLGNKSHIVLIYLQSLAENNIDVSERERIFSDVLHETDPEKLIDRFERMYSAFGEVNLDA